MEIMYTALCPSPESSPGSSSWPCLKTIYEPCHEKTNILHMLKFTGTLNKNQNKSICINKDADPLISTFVFTTWIVQSLSFLTPKFQASSHLLYLYSLVCVGPGWKLGLRIDQIDRYDMCIDTK